MAAKPWDIGATQKPSTPGKEGPEQESYIPDTRLRILENSRSEHLKGETRRNGEYILHELLYYPPLHDMLTELWL
jgi:hypothetical protein